MPRKRLPERDLPLTHLEGLSAVLRPAETIRAEEALLAAEAEAEAEAADGGPPPPPGARGPSAPENARTDVRTHDAAHGGGEVRRPGGADERENARIQVRNAFNVWDDQLRSLAEIQAYRYRTTGKKPQLSHLVQEALDAYIARWRRIMTERAREP